ncbi:SDR family oxidoreductase [Wenzhouxiangella sp. EGI_FJ10305]|uniref:SDR family oxidoreductase n=1 Tax=Wenzhouxiangella sp. EGI_FJ10305 TaxID=3243768 RepID=UPI0035DC8ADE
MKRLLIAGCGDLGIRLAGRLDRDQWQVSGLRRRVEALPETIIPVSADLSEPGTLAAVAGDWDAVVYQATPDQYDEAGYRRAYFQGLANLFERVRARRLIFVSSTAVYGQDEGEWVDEASETEPARFNGRVLLEAEALAARSAPEAVVVRFSGIYGPGRDFLVRKVAAGEASCRENPPQWTNRIHADDCAGVLAHLLTLEAPETLYCATDSRSARRCEVLDWLAGQLHAAAPSRETGSGGQGKRVANARLLASGYRLIHPDYRSGYQELLQ